MGEMCDCERDWMRSRLEKVRTSESEKREVKKKDREDSECREVRMKSSIYCRL